VILPAIKISELPEIESIVSSSVVPVVAINEIDDPVTYKITIENLANSISSLINIATVDPLPIGLATGSILSSGSGADNKPYYWNGGTWTPLF